MNMQKTTDNFLIATMSAEHVKPMVIVHLSAFPNFFLSFLGARFLEAFYNSFINKTCGVAMVALNDKNAVIGGIVGPLLPHGFFKRLLLKKCWLFAILCIPAFFKKPSIFFRLLQNLFYRGNEPDDGINRALLSSVAVAPEAQGRGIGKELITAWLEKVRNAGCAGAYLTTDAVNNDQTNTFYQRLGWILESQYTTPQGRKMNRYVFNFK